MNQADLAALLRQHARRHAVPGAAIGILREGTATAAQFGVADVMTGEPVTPETLFSVGSLTKSMVATVIAQLAETGRLSLDDRVADHVPELRGSRWAQRATVHDLLANRSRLPLRAALEFDLAGRTDETGGALSRLAADIGAHAAAAPVWSYTNVGWCLLGRVIETAVNAAWEEAMRRHLFDPADMSATTFTTDVAPKKRASGHEHTPDGSMYRTLFADLMQSSFGISVPPLCLDPSPDAAGDLSRFAGVYAWPDRRVEVIPGGNGLVIKDESGETEARPLDQRTFLVDAKDPDNPTVTFGAFDGAGRPGVLYQMLWGLPRVR